MPADPGVGTTAWRPCETSDRGTPCHGDYPEHTRVGHQASNCQPVENPFTLMATDRLLIIEAVHIIGIYPLLEKHWGNRL